MRKSYSYLLIFLSLMGISFYAKGEGLAGARLAKEAELIQSMHEIRLLVERESYEFTKSLCYIFKFRHKYGNEKFPSTVVFHGPRLIQKLPSDEKLRDSVAKWLFLGWKDAIALFSDTGQREYGILYRSAYSKFLPGASGFMKAATECGEEMGKENFPDEIAEHIRVNSSLAASLSLAGIFRLVEVSFLKIINIASKSFIVKLSPSMKKTLTWGAVGVGTAALSAFSYFVFMEVYEQQKDIEKTKKMLNGELPVLREEAIWESDTFYMKTMLTLFYRDYIYFRTNPNDSFWRANCLDRRETYYNIFSTNKNILIELLEEIPRPEEASLKALSQAMEAGEKLLEEEELELYQTKLYYALHLIVDYEASPEFSLKEGKGLLFCESPFEQN